MSEEEAATQGKAPPPKKGEAPAAGAHVLYEPDVEAYWDGRDAKGRRLFVFEYAADHPLGTWKKGQPVNVDHYPPGTSDEQRGFSRVAGHAGPHNEGLTRKYDGAPVQAVRSTGPWPAVVTAAHEDGSADLDVKHPNGYATLHIPRVPAGEPGQSHTYRRAERGHRHPHE